MYLDLSTRKRAGLQKNQNSSDMKQILIKSVFLQICNQNLRAPDKRSTIVFGLLSQNKDNVLSEQNTACAVALLCGPANCPLPNMLS